MTLDGKTLDHFGLMLIKSEGLLDMPSRIGEITYNWGNEIELLVHPLDIFWKGRQISCEYFFDGDRYSLTKLEFTNRISLLTNQFILTSELGNFNVQIKEIKEVKSYSTTRCVFKINFFEAIPKFSVSPINPALNTGLVRIDGHDLSKEFGIIVSKITGRNNLSQSENSSLTVFNTSQKLTTNRKLKVITIECKLPFNNKIQLKIAVNKLKKILSKSELRHLYINGIIYQAVFHEGFKTILKPNLAEFKIPLTII